MSKQPYNETVPGSVADAINHDIDPALAALYWDNLRKFAGDQKSMEDWARDGFISSAARNHDLREEDLV